MSVEIFQKTIKNTLCMHNAMAEAAGIGKARCRCERCKKEVEVDGAHCLQHGWPKCCGYTMTLLTGKK